MNHESLMRGVFPRALPFIGMVHLQPLPGAPRFAGSMNDVIDRALADATALQDGGADGMIVENYLDAPFYPDGVPSETVAAMSVIIAQIVRASSVPIGVNVLRNDAASALAIAAATGARFIRVNVHTGTMNTDQGTLTGQAHRTLRARAQLAPSVAIAADVLVKHAVPPAGLTIEQAAGDAWHRGLADALVVSGIATGTRPDPERLRKIRASAPGAVLWIGSGLTADNARELIPLCDGAIVGSALSTDGVAGSGIDTRKVRALADVFTSLRPGTRLEWGG
jgi:uncharacterized protein